MNSSAPFDVQASPPHLAIGTLAERRFFGAMAWAMLVVVFIGFSRSFFLRPLFPDHAAASETIFFVHGAVFAAWFVLLVVQTSLVANERIGVHRRIGPFGALLAVAMLVLGLWGSLVAAARPEGFVAVPVPPLQFLAIPIFDVGLFTVFVALALGQRRNPQAHKRWMLLATINLLAAAIARWPGVLDYGPPAFWGLTDLFIVALALWDFRSRGRLHPVTLWGGLAIILSQPLRMVLAGTDGWDAFARWATGLVG
ncbi:hypothetical protein [Marilutibacter alkalisoli]|uniref:Uncharacterized protein n=1 Tax=Marilutibacter alkalisoli TaxID=2591633 RepID=A0A514BUL9_9GAMM|nr:hypothetical protein [Lysobacter alkalisoli]QDH71093.1 hypothetical protein FKV23_14100 [Lysobacter alkalisoli]